jgi:hypothetical protein
VPDAPPYRAPQPVRYRRDPYAFAWESKQRFRFFAWTVVLIPAVGTAVVCYAGGAAYHPWWLVFLAFSGLVPALLAWTHCPYCGARWPSLRVTHKCDKCGIPWGTPRSAVVEAEKQAAGGFGPRVADTNADAMHAEADPNAGADASEAPSRIAGA